jgi:predicted ester cyclase
VSAENKALTRRLEEQVWNEGNLDITDEIMAPDFVAHVGGAPAALRGPAAVKEWAALWRTAFPDVHATVEDVIAEHDKVVTRITLTGTHQGPLIRCAGDRQVRASHGNRDQPIRRRKAGRNTEHLRHGGSCSARSVYSPRLPVRKGIHNDHSKRRGREL